MEREKSQRNHDSALNPAMASDKILILIGKFQAFRITCIMLILEIFKNEEIRNHHSRNFNSSYFMGHTMDVSWLSNWKLKPCFPDSISPLLY